ncbi:unnamed protein product [Amoebophrya sp. A25]|nr:unnamed protein product [Amoebophrya sp. A25]|eukprot:GSA25T00016274001.1
MVVFSRQSLELGAPLKSSYTSGGTSRTTSGALRLSKAGSVQASGASEQQDAGYKAAASSIKGGTASGSGSRRGTKSTLPDPSQRRKHTEAGLKQVMHAVVRDTGVNLREEGTGQEAIDLPQSSGGVLKNREELLHEHHQILPQHQAASSSSTSVYNVGGTTSTGTAAFPAPPPGARSPRVAVVAGTESLTSSRGPSSGGSSLTSSRRSSAATDQRLEELLLQNAELKRNLQLLQAGVVESMRGNKARFMGSGGGGGGVQTSSNKASSAKLPNLQDLDELKFLLSRKNQQIAELEAHSTENAAQIKRLGRQFEDATVRHGRELGLWEERWSGRVAETERLEERVRLALADLDRASSETSFERQRADDSEAKIAEWDTKLADLEAKCHNLEENATREAAEAAAAKTAAGDEAKRAQEREELLHSETERLASELKSRKSELDAVMAEKSSLQAALNVARANCDKSKSQMFAVSLRVLALSNSSDGLLRSVFDSWRAEQLHGKLTWEQKQRQAVEAGGQKRAAELGEALAIARREFDAAKAEWVAFREAQTSDRDAALSAELARIKADLQAARKDSDALRSQKLAAEKQVSALRKQKDAEISKLQTKIKDLEASIRAAKDEAAASSSEEEMHKFKLAQEAEAMTQKEFYKKREDTLVKENQALQDKLKELTPTSGGGSSGSSFYAKQVPDHGDKKWRQKLRQVEEEHKRQRAEWERERADLREGRSREEEQAKEIADLKQRLEQARREAGELSAAKAHAEKERDAAGGRSSKSSPVESRTSHKELEKEPWWNDLELARREIAELLADRAELLKRSESVEASLGLADERAGRWKDAVEENVQAVRRNLRMLVTAPKISINVGGNNDFHVKSSFPYEEIRSAIKAEIIPKFQRCMHISEEKYGSDSDVKQLVYKGVEDLALTLQTKIHELVPSAEGTCHWDGFGCAKTSASTDTPVHSSADSPVKGGSHQLAKAERSSITGTSQAQSQSRSRTVSKTGGSHSPSKTPSRRPSQT